MVPDTINANIAQCLKSAHYFGYTRIHNVCTSTTFDVPWGGADWALAFGLAGLLIAGGFMLLSMAIVMIRDAS